VKIPVTVKMRAGWDADAINAPDLAKRIEDAGAAAVAVHGRTAAQSYSGFCDWELIARIASELAIPVFGSGDCVEPLQMVEKLRSGVAGVLVGRGALRNPWIFEQAADLAAGRTPREITAEERGRFLLDYIEMLQNERVREPEGFRHVAPGLAAAPGASELIGAREARGHDRWVINKLRALNSWYTKGIEGGSHLRVAVNAAESIPHLRAIIEDFFFARVAC
jgi:tRNA-dihydrouridine synthase B